MTTKALDRLVDTGQLKTEPPAAGELEGSIRSGLARLHDAENETLSLDGRFDLAYNAAQRPEAEKCQTTEDMLEKLTREHGFTDCGDDN